MHMSMKIAALHTSEGKQGLALTAHQQKSPGPNNDGEQITGSCINKEVTMSFYNGC